MKEILYSHFENFIDLTEYEFEYIYSHLKIKKYKKHQFLFQEGDVVSFDYFIINGIVKTYLVDVDGKERIIDLSYDNLWISDYPNLFEQSTTNLYASCIVDTIVCCISIEDIDKLSEEIPSILKYFRIRGRQGIIKREKRITSLLMLNIKERLEVFKSDFSPIFNKLPKSIIASYIGVSRETLSRLNKKKRNNTLYPYPFLSLQKSKKKRPYFTIRSFQ